MSDNNKKSAKYASGSHFGDENRPEDEIKPLANSGDFSDDWLGDLDDALEFDPVEPTNKKNSGDEDIDIGEIEVVDVDDTFSVDLEVFDDLETLDQVDAPDLSDSVEISLEDDDMASKPEEAEINIDDTDSKSEQVEINLDDDTTSTPETPEMPEVPESKPEKEIRRSYTAQTLDIVTLQQGTCQCRSAQRSAALAVRIVDRNAPVRRSRTHPCPET